MGVMNRPVGELVPGMLKSKKGLTLLVSVGMLLFAGQAIDPQLQEEIVKLAMAYMVGQGVADAGKEKARLQIVADRAA